MENKKQQFVDFLNNQISNSCSFTLKISDFSEFLNKDNFFDVGDVYFNFSIFSKQLKNVEIISFGQSYSLTLKESDKIYKSWKLLTDVSKVIEQKILNGSSLVIEDIELFFNQF